MSQGFKFLMLSVVILTVASAQSTPAPNVFNVLSWSSVFNQTVYKPNPNGGAPISIGTLTNAVPNVYAGAGAPAGSYPFPTVSVSTSIIKVNNAVNSNVATALGVIPLASPASGVIFQTDPSSGVDWPASSTLGPVFTERGETIGKNKFYLGVTHDDFHFTKLNGQSLNSLQVLYPGGTPSGVVNSGTTLTSYPATFDIGMDVRLSQDVAFLTYGINDRVDVSLGLPIVHAAVAARTYNGILYTGGGLGAEASAANNSNINCWCAGSFNPGYFVSPSVNFTLPSIGQSSLAKTGFGDMLLRVKGTVLHNQRAAVALGGDIRFATGDAENYLGTGTTSFKPFVAVSLYTAPRHGVVFSPHVNLAWQVSGKSVLGGQLQPNTTLQATLNDTSGPLTYQGAPLTATKNYLPDVFSWAVGSEVAFGRQNTIIMDILGNQIGLVHGAPSLITGTASGFLPCANSPCPAVTNIQGLESGIGTTSYSQFSGAFGYKARVYQNLVFTISALVRFDSNGLTARFTPLYGLGYSF